MQPIRANRRTRFPKWIGTILILLATAMAIGGCSVPSSEKTDRFDPTASLEGRWKVSAIDGESLVGVPVEVRGSSLVWEPECAGKVVDYRRAGDVIRFTPRPLRHNEGELPIVCSIGVPQAVVTLFDILPSLDRVSAQSQTKIALSNHDHIVHLERPGTDVIWPDGRWSLSSLDGRSLPDAQPTFQVRDGWINWMPVCAQQGRSFHIENDRIAVRPIRVASPLPPPGATLQPPPICPLPLHPKLATAFSAMEAVTHIRIDPRGSVQLEGAGHHLIFNREPR